MDKIYEHVLLQLYNYWADLVDGKIESESTISYMLKSGDVELPVNINASLKWLRERGYARVVNDNDDKELIDISVKNCIKSNSTTAHIRRIICCQTIYTEKGQGYLIENKLI